MVEPVTTDLIQIYCSKFLKITFKIGERLGKKLDYLR